MVIPFIGAISAKAHWVLFYAIEWNILHLSHHLVSVS